jgi:NAD(P)-dependent dehydrogenase (short-subunit alcohol dehydrogenase family)
MSDVKDKVIVVTGSNSQLASEIICSLYKNGSNLALSSRHLDKLNEFVKTQNFSLDRVLTQKTDVRQKAELDLLMDETVSKFGKIDVLLAFACVQIRKPALEFTKEDWQLVLDVNLNGSFFAAQAVAKPMTKQQSGKIIFVSSLTAEIGLPQMSAYVASKGAIKQLAKALAVEWADNGITVNCIGPGRFHTQMTDDIFKNKETRESFLNCIPMKRPGRPMDLVGICLFLCSSQSDYFTGQSFYPDGGWLASGGAKR